MAVDDPGFIKDPNISLDEPSAMETAPGLSQPPL